MNDTQTQTLFGTQVVISQPVMSIAELVELWYTQPDYYLLESVEIGNDVAAVLVARQMRKPIERCEPLSQCGQQGCRMRE